MKKRVCPICKEPNYSSNARQLVWYCHTCESEISIDYQEEAD